MVQCLWLHKFKENLENKAMLRLEYLKYPSYALPCKNESTLYNNPSDHKLWRTQPTVGLRQSSEGKSEHPYEINFSSHKDPDHEKIQAEDIPMTPIVKSHERTQERFQRKAYSHNSR